MKATKEDVRSITSLKSQLETLKCKLIKIAILKERETKVEEKNTKRNRKDITGIEEIMLDLNGDNIEYILSLVEESSHIIYPETVTLDYNHGFYSLVYYQFDDTEKQIIEICLNKRDIENNIKVKFSPLTESMLIGIREGKIHMISSKEKTMGLKRQMR